MRSQLKNCISYERCTQINTLEIDLQTALVMSDAHKLAHSRLTFKTALVLSDTYKHTHSRLTFKTAVAMRDAHKLTHSRVTFNTVVIMECYTQTHTLETNLQSCISYGMIHTNSHTRDRPCIT